MNTQFAGHCLTETEMAHSPLWAVVPVKALGKAKKRLESCLGDHREGFALAMLSDVLAALTSSKKVDRIACVTADPKVVALADQYGVTVIEEKCFDGMNAAIQLGINSAREQGARRVVILPADLPLATGEEIDRLLLSTDAAASPELPTVIGLGAARKDDGTNFLSLDTSQPFETRYGPDSFHVHQAQALSMGFQPVRLFSDTLSLDIDSESDLQAFIAVCRRDPKFQATHTCKFLFERGLVAVPTLSE